MCKLHEVVDTSVPHWRAMVFQQVSDVQEKARGIEHFVVEFLVDERRVKDFPDICGMLRMLLCLLSDVVGIGIDGGIRQGLDDEEHDFEKLCEEDANARGHTNSIGNAG